MFSRLRFVVLACAVIAAACPSTCEAYVQRVQFPLSGYRHYAGGKGLVTFAERFGESGYSDGATLIVEVSNVPLPAGTELEVIVHEKTVGTVKLNKDRGGRLVLESNSRKSIPRLSTGSLVTLRLPAGGSTVLW